MIGIGIDTGGTCTDAVVYNIDSGEIIATAKTMTTKRDLKIGIEKALSMVPLDALKECGQIALSTTLATNACVEDLGGHGKLILIGVEPKIFYDTYTNYGFTDTKDTYILPCRITTSGETTEEPDWTRFKEDMEDFLVGAQCVGVVQLYSKAHLAKFEKKASEIIKGIIDVPVILGNDLFIDLNAIRRGAGALLNARLVPVVYEFMTAINEVFARKGLDLPTTIIKSDGSQMSKEFALMRPVETLLCGPAASVVGAGALTNAKEAMIVDIGGTTTDIALIKNSLAKRSDEGIQVGDWKTFVRGLFIDTFGLGGDTAIHYEFSGKIYLENYRVISLCSLASEYPEVLSKLQLLAEGEKMNPMFLHEFVVLIHDSYDENDFSDAEKKLINKLKNGPLSTEEAAIAMGTDIYKMNISHLEKEGIVIRAGLTPTDIMHIRGDYTAFSVEASLAAAEFVLRCCNLNSVEALCNEVYRLVEKRLYENIIRIYLQQNRKALNWEKPTKEINELISYAFEIANKGEENIEPFDSIFKIKPALIGVGAPTHVFLPRVAKLLGCECIIPEHAEVANAIGAIASQVIAIEEVTVLPLHNEDEGNFEVLSREHRRKLYSYEKALEYAEEVGKKEVLNKVKEQGAGDDVTIIKEVIKDELDMRYGPVWMGDVVRFTAKGSLS